MIKGIGIDIVSVARIQEALDRGKNHFLSRVFTAQEIDYCKKGKDAVQKYAARFAAKEAAMKALGTGWAKGVHWKDIEIISDRKGAPQLVLKRGSLAIFQEMGARTLHVSLSHHKEFAAAVVVLES
jgi:holo-[acyl-carrier protein] synthase